MSAPPVPAPPPGYRQTKLIDPFEIYVGPLFETGDGPDRRFLFVVDERHVNMRGAFHGGMMMTLADMTLGWAVWAATDFAATVTVNMQTQFLKSAKAGDHVEVKTEITRQTRSLVFARADFVVDGEIIFTASSVWKLLGKG